MSNTSASVPPSIPVRAPTSIARRSIAFLLAGTLAPAAFAQTNNQWVTFVRDFNRLHNPDGTPAAHIMTDTAEKDYASADVDHDGWVDLVVVRKMPASTTGKRAAQLLMNEGGILVDRTAQHASDSDIAGDMGFLTPTNNRDVQCVDLDGDGWEDIVTATTLSDGDPKHLSHPRVYRNKGSIGGVWQGFKHEDARIPQLLTTAGLPVAPRFNSVSTGDVDGDGFPDLYFADSDSTGTLITEPANWDLDDKLLLNDGFGFFTDSGTSAMSAQMLQSGFGHSSAISDMNGDGVNDVVKGAAPPGPPSAVTVAYNDPNNIGHFVHFQASAASGSAYYVNVGDLNADGMLDLVVSHDSNDFVRYNTGVDALGGVIWGSQTTYAFVSTVHDDGFGGTNQVVDLDNDGFGDTIHADFDVDVIGCSRRCHIYHNPGGAVGSQMTLIEEAEFTNNTGWKGVVGPHAADLTGTFDVAVFDLDNDGDKDIVMGRCAGTQVWINQLLQPTTTTPYCFGDGTGTACPCGDNSAVGNDEGCLNSLGTGGRLRGLGVASLSNDTFVLTGTRMTNSSVLYFQGNTQVGAGTGAVFGDGLRCATGSVKRLVTKTNVNGSSLYPVVGEQPISVNGAVPAGATRKYQGWYRNASVFCNPETFNLTNGVSVVWTP